MIRDLKNFSESLKLKEISTLSETMVDKSREPTKLSMFKETSTLSILQRNYMKMIPIIKELHKSLVREEGEPETYEDEIEISSSDDESECILPPTDLLDDLD